ncbi:putative YigZ family protein [Pullulanibacillus pueri]|uniref:IMPACT family member YvyE n=1 Tax=Pullulanibacillus pueri TaxID=1437324 RepID=A0A8J3EKT0_9BACL|nr:YigZ family protein [Pullulanibacillus pueri]MBM7684264.1 putative YigZ family protein [Pullulanibacillus pueri]GGH76656.1 IMPACT family member YvyE [Pullulanibacillus pueri]
MPQVYYTVKTQAENDIIIQKSRFIASVHRIKHEEEAQRIIEGINKAHWKANHHCYAYVCGENNQVQKASDDGEPSGTAGVPILEVLKKKDLRDTLVVVTRYFGGIKLGAGGLIRAYSQATSEGIKAAGVVERIPVKIFTTTFSYPLLGSVENALRQSPYIIRDMAYTDTVTIEVGVRETDVAGYSEWITNLCNGQCDIKDIGDTFIEVDVDR